MALLFKDPRESLLFYRKLFGTGENSLKTGFNDWKYASEYNDSHERPPNRSGSIKIFLNRST